MLDKLQIYCPRRTGGCTWSGPRGNLTSHNQSCTFYPCINVNVGCSWIGAPTGATRDGHNTTCGYASISCEHAPECSWNGQRQHYGAHILDNCVYLQRLASEAAELEREAAESERIRVAEIAENERRIKIRLEAKEVDSALSSLLRTTYVQLAVGDRIIHTSMKVLGRYPNSLLARMSTRLDALPKNGDGIPWLDRDPVAFSALIYWLRWFVLLSFSAELRHITACAIIHRDVTTMDVDIAQLVEEAAFFRIPFDSSKLRRRCS
jgi:Zn-finger protein